MTAPERDALRYPGFCDGIDVSSVQTITSAKAVAAAGFLFATVKSAEGLLYCDPRALDHLAKLRDAGLLCNVYTFLRPSQGDPRGQVRKAFECAGHEFPMRLMLDAEGALDGVTDAALIAFYEEAIDETLLNGTLPPEFYSYPDFVRRRLMPALARSTVIGQCPYVAADYQSNTVPMVPHRGYVPWFPKPTWTTWTKHQYSGDHGFRVPGISGDCDRMLFNGDDQELRVYYGLPRRPTPPDQIPRVMPDLAADFLKRPIGE